MNYYYYYYYYGQQCLYLLYVLTSEDDYSFATDLHKAIPIKLNVVLGRPTNPIFSKTKKKFLISLPTPFSWVFQV